MGRVSLVTPPLGAVLGLEMTTMVEPLGLECVAGSLIEQGHECQVIDLRVGGLKHGLESVRRFGPDVIGVQCSFTSERFRAAALLRELRRIVPDARLVAGGHDASAQPEWLLNAGADAVVVGDGELTMPALVRAWEKGHEPADVRGLAMLSQGEVAYTGDCDSRPDIDKLPLPARHLISRNAGRYYCSYSKPTALLETTRGCPYRCSFCSVWKFHQGKCRLKSAPRVLRELQDIRAPSVFVTDDIFFLDAERDDELARLIADSVLRKHFIVQTRTDIIVRNPELLKKWHGCGGLTVFLGLEKIDDEGLQAINKRNTTRNNERAIEILRGLGVGYTPNLIVDPEWDHADFARLRDWISATGSYNSGFSILTPLPGTQLWDEEHDRVVTSDWELFDLEHAVLPTKLPLEEFYAEYSGLWRHAMEVRRSARGRFASGWRMIRALASGRVTPGAIKKGIRIGKALSHPRWFLRAHRER